MKWCPQEALARHAAEVLVDPRSKPEDLAAARRAIADFCSEEAPEALGDEDLERLEREVQAQLEASARGRCVTCGARCMTCASRDAEHSPPVDGEAGGWGGLPSARAT